MTLISRLLGFVRDMIIARLFGADAATDAFFVSFKIPNFLRRLFAEGAFSQALVPALSDYRDDSERCALKRFVDRSSGTLALILLGLTVVGVIAAPVWVFMFAPGFTTDDRRFDLAVEMLRLTFPYLLFIGCTGFAGAILNAFGRFAVPALTPALLNLGMIGAALWLAPQMDEPVVALSLGVFAAGLVQLALQFPALMGIGLVPRLRWGFHDPVVLRVIKRMGPALFGASVTQLNLLLDTFVASFLVAGGVSWLYYSDRLVEFPVGVFGMAVATVILPDLSKNHAADPVAFSRALDWGLRLVLLIGLPATFGLVLLARPLLATLFQYDAFGARDVAMAAQSLAAYAVGLSAYILVKLLVSGFAARRDLRTPVRFGMVAVGANFVLNLALVHPMGHGGLALATALSAWLNAGLLFRRLCREGGYRPDAGWRAFGIRVFVASVAMGLLLCFGVDASAWGEWEASRRILHLGFWVLAGMAVYGMVLTVGGLRLRHLGLEN